MLWVKNCSERHKGGREVGGAAPPEKRRVRQHHPSECEHHPTEREEKNSTTSRKKKMEYPSPSSLSVSDGDDRQQSRRRSVWIVSIVTVGRGRSFRGSTTPKKEGGKQPPTHTGCERKSSTTPNRNWRRERLHNSLHIKLNQILKLTHNNFTKVSFYWKKIWKLIEFNIIRLP